MPAGKRPAPVVRVVSVDLLTAALDRLRRDAAATLDGPEAEGYDQACQDVKDAVEAWAD